MLMTERLLAKSQGRDARSGVDNPAAVNFVKTFGEATIRGDRTLISGVP
jgi:hypothetical protein